MNKLIDYLKKFLHLGINISITILILSVVIQVFSRFFLPSTPSWTEEMSRMSFIFIVGFAAPLALLEDHLVRVDILFNRLPVKYQNMLEIFIKIIIGIFLVILSYHTYFAVGRLGMEQTPILKISLRYPMLLFLGSYLTMLLFLIFQLIEMLKNKEKI